MPDVGGAAVLGAPTGGVAYPLVAADPACPGGRGKRRREAHHHLILTD